jgi:hypothetical protein
VIRIVMWVGLWLVTLGALSIHVSYTDGLDIDLHGWLDAIMRKR